ncbi:MAG: CHAT domain-containing tetratricopeptide repeat protein [Cytophagales bacterium]|nr:CHAT domain-containing tetratricopeptide repeat protein [Cytophagales bacterium]
MKPVAFFKPLLCSLSLLILFNSHAQYDLLENAVETFEQGDFAGAYEQFSSVGATFKDLGENQLYSLCQLRMASCQISLGNFQESKSLAENALNFINTNLSNQALLQAESYSLIGESELNLGRNDVALENLLEAERLFPKEPSAFLAECYEDLGLTYWNNQNYDLAIQYHEKALDMRQTLFGKRSLAAGDSYNNLGITYIEENPFQASLYLTRTRQIYEQELGTDHPKVAYCLLNLARANEELNNFAEALQLVESVQEIWNEQYGEEDHPNKAFTLSALGRTNLESGAFDEAENALQASLQMYIRIYGDKHPDVSNAYALLGQFFYDQGKWKQAIRYYDQSIYANLSDQAPGSKRQLPKLQGYFNVDALLQSLIAKARAYENFHIDKSMQPAHLQIALNTFAQCDTLIGQIRQLRQNDNDKLRLAKDAKDVYDNAIRISLMLANQPFQEKKYHEIAFNFSERSKSAVLLEAISETKAKGFAGIPDQLIEQEDSLKNEISYLNQKLAASSKEEEQNALKGQLFTYQAAYREFIDQLEEDYPKYFDLKYNTQMATVADLQKALPEGHAILSYFEGESRLYTFMITANGLEIFNKPKGDDYQKQPTGLRNAIKYNIQSAFEKSAKALYELLIPDLPKDINQLVIIPDGVLGTIPFEALVNPTSSGDQYKDLTYLLVEYDVSYDYSATLFAERMRPAEERPTSQDILLMAPVEFDRSTGMATLKGTEKELQSIQYLFQGNDLQVESRLMANASENFVKGPTLDQYKYLHFATHGLVHESEPELSRIFLSPSDGEDGSLYSGEIYNLKINAELVTLSACETGLGKVAKGEGIVGLSRALLYAGAKNLIVSLWPVADESTSELMIEFYRQHLFSAYSMHFAGALRESKLTMMRSEEFQRPYYWAPFILVGM